METQTNRERANHSLPGEDPAENQDRRIEHQLRQINRRDERKAAKEEELRSELEATYGVENVWNTSELTRDFEVKQFFAPFASVTRKKDKVAGVVQFTHAPRFYFDFVAQE